jgi:uncharacterized membrane protein
MALFASDVSLPTDFQTNFLMLLRWIHFIAGITWIGLLYFFNLINIPFMKELDPATKGKIMPGLMLRALLWFRVSAVVTVLAGLAYWGSIVGSDARNAGAAPTTPLVSFLVVWSLTWGLMYALLLPGKGILDRGWVLAILYIVIVAHSAHLFLHWNSQGWESNRLLAIGIGGGIGWMMMLSVWGIIWRIQKRLIAWTKANVENGTPMPEQSARMARMAFLASRTNFYLSFPLLFFMGAASHYPMFGR